MEVSPHTCCQRELLKHERHYFKNQTANNGSGYCCFFRDLLWRFSSSMFYLSFGSCNIWRSLLYLFGFRYLKAITLFVWLFCFLHPLGNLYP